ncbi:MAG: Os1348 family NHLP clan protein [Litorilinea sp.]
MATLQEIAIRIITDDAFAQALLANPAEVLRAEGIEPTPEMLEAVKGIDLEELQNLTAAFTDESKAM